MRRFVLLLVLLGTLVIIVGISACSPAPTPTPAPTATPPPPTATNTSTPIPTATPLPTDTLTPAPTPTVTDTPTPEVVYGQLKVCVTPTEGINPGIGSSGDIFDAEGRRPVDCSQGFHVMTGRCTVLKNLLPGPYKVSVKGFLNKSQDISDYFSADTREVVVLPGETVEIEMVVSLAGE